MKFVTLLVLFAVLFAVASATPSCEEFVGNLPNSASAAIRSACQNGAKSWFCEECGKVF